MALSLDVTPEGGRVVLEERKDDRPEDREDDTDRAIKLARAHCIEAVEFLVFMMNAQQGSGEDRSRAAIALLEVAGCL